jgi:hypothetical protein
MLFVPAMAALCAAGQRDGSALRCRAARWMSAHKERITMSDLSPQGSSTTSPPSPKRARLSKLAGLLFGSGAAVLIPALALGAGYTRGCAVAPIHGSGVQVARGPLPTFPVRYAAVTADTATRVAIQFGKPVKNATGVGAPTAWTTLKTVVPVADANGNKQVDTNVEVPIDKWAQDDVIAFRGRETLANGTVQTIDTVGVGASKTPHSIGGVMDLPGVADLPSLRIFPVDARINNQEDDTFLYAKTFGPNIVPPVQAYYASIGAPSTFGAWKSANGFPTNEIVTFYRNENDLGFGREMRCRLVQGGITPGKIACYVTNYPNEDDAAAGVNKTATVAMEWSAGGFLNPATNRVVDPKETVRFYVYDTGVGEFRDLDNDNLTNDLLNSVALDGGGNKPVPGLCLNCHGGTRAVAANESNKQVVRGARFLPWDTLTLPVPSSKGAQSESFRRLNAYVWMIEIMDGRMQGPLAELTDGWYGGDGNVNVPNSSFSGAYVPSGWSGNPAMYLGMVAPFCRSCHIAQPGREFHTLASLDGYRARIIDNLCKREGSIMPHAERTYIKFWQSGAAAFVGVDLGAGSCAFEPFPPLVP